MDQSIRDDIAASAAAHRELGRDYDSAVAEGLVDRIGAEIDKRIDSRLSSPRSDSRLPAKFSLSGETQAAWIGGAVGAGVTGLAAVLADRANTGPNSGAVVVAVVWVWVIMVIAAVSVAIVRRHRRP